MYNEDEAKKHLSSTLKDIHIKVDNLRTFLNSKDKFKKYLILLHGEFSNLERIILEYKMKKELKK